MSYWLNEVPSGAINGINLTFTTLYNIDTIVDIVVDGAEYVDGISKAGNQFTLDWAPTATIYISYWDAPPTPPPAGAGTSLGNHKTNLNYALGTAETSLFSVDKRVDAINSACEWILQQFDIPQYLSTVSLNFVAGKSNLPGDCLMPQKLSDPNDPYKVYEEIDYDKFAFNLSYTYNIYYDEIDLVEKIRIYPADTVTLGFGYRHNFLKMVDDTDGTRFGPWWDKAIAEKAAELLFTASRNLNIAEAKRELADNLIAKAWQVERARLTGQQDQKLTSVFARKSILGTTRSITR